MKTLFIFLLIASFSKAIEAPTVTIQAECDGVNTVSTLNWPVVPTANRYDVYYSPSVFGEKSLFQEDVTPPFMAVIPTEWDWQYQSDQLGFFSVVAMVVVPGQVANYTFNGNTLNVLGTGHNGTNYGATYVNDRHSLASSALSFDGINDYVLMEDPLLLNRFSISAWIKLSLPFGLQNMSMIRHRHHAYNIAILNIGGNARLFCDVWLDQTTEYSYTSGGIGEADGNWHHVVLTYNMNEFAVFFDGVERYRSSQYGQNRAVYYGDGATAFGRSGDYSGFYFRGSLDDIVYFDRSLNIDEVGQLYQN